VNQEPGPEPAADLLRCGREWLRLRVRGNGLEYVADEDTGHEVAMALPLMHTPEN